MPRLEFFPTPFSKTACSSKIGVLDHDREQTEQRECSACVGFWPPSSHSRVQKEAFQLAIIEEEVQWHVFEIIFLVPDFAFVILSSFLRKSEARPSNLSAVWRFRDVFLQKHTSMAETESQIAHVEDEPGRL